MKVMVNNFFSQKEKVALNLLHCTLTLFTWVECQVTDSQHSGMSQSYSRSETGISSRYLKITLSSFGHNCLLFIVLFAISYTKPKKSNYLNSHGEEAQEKPPGL